MSEPPGRADHEPARVRLFVALELDADVRAELVRWRAGAVDRHGLRPVAAEYLHVTLCFLGAVGSGQVGDIMAACAVVGGACAPRLRLDEGVWLPPRRPRVLAVVVADRSGALAGVQSALAQALSSGGWYRPERRPFFAHATVARVRAGSRVRASALERPAPLELCGRRVTLFRSRLGPGGARYEAVGTVELGGRRG